MPNTDESSAAGVYSKYRANYGTTAGCIWTADAVATVKLMDIGFESERDTRRLGRLLGCQDVDRSAVLCALSALSN